MKAQMLNRMKCSVCTASYTNSYFKDIFIEHTPRVCSPACFKKLIEQTKPDYITKDITAKIVKRNPPFTTYDFKSKYEYDFMYELFKMGFKRLSYEPYVFQCEGHNWYTPDFLLFPYLIFFEVKGIWERKAKAKFTYFVEHYGFKTYLIDRDFLTFLKIGRW